MNGLAPILITGCTFLAVGHGTDAQINSGLVVRFQNVGKETFKRITWRATTVIGSYDYVDDGTFSPGVTIIRRPAHRGTDHQKTIEANLEVMEPGICSVIETQTADGAEWKDPNAGVAMGLFLPPIPPDDAPTLPASFPNATQNPIGIVSCAFTVLNADIKRAFGHVRFRNLASQPIAEITFRAFFDKAGMDFVKAGTFAPGVLVDTAEMRRKDLPPNAFPTYVALDSPKSCIAVSVRYADGTTWLNPTVEPTEPPFPDPRAYVNAHPQTP